MNDLELAKKILSDKGATMVAVKNCVEYISHKRGVAPILDVIDKNPDFFNGASVVDKVIGKAAAILLAKYSVSRIHAGVISQKALDFLRDKPIAVTYDVAVDHIINRDKTDMCPMEKCVFDITDCDEAEVLIRQTRQKLIDRQEK